MSDRLSDLPRRGFCVAAAAVALAGCGRETNTFPIADGRLPGMAAEDIGRTAFGVFKAGDAFIGKTVSIAGEHLSGADMAAGAGLTGADGAGLAMDLVSATGAAGLGGGAAAVCTGGLTGVDWAGADWTCAD